MSQADGRQIHDGELDIAKFAHYNWSVISAVSGTALPLMISGTMISGLKTHYRIKQIYRQSGTNLPYQVKDTIYRVRDGLQLWEKNCLLVRNGNNQIIGTNATIIGEGTDK